VTTPHVSQEAATVQIETRVRNDGTRAARCTLATSILDRTAKQSSPRRRSRRLRARGVYEFVQQVTVAKPNLWSGSQSVPVQSPQHSAPTRPGVTSTIRPIGIRRSVFDADKGIPAERRAREAKRRLHPPRRRLRRGCRAERVWERASATAREWGATHPHQPQSLAEEFSGLVRPPGIPRHDEAFDEWKVPKGQIGPYGYSNYFDEWYERDVRISCIATATIPRCIVERGQRDRRPVPPPTERIRCANCSRSSTPKTPPGW